MHVLFSVRRLETPDCIDSIAPRWACKHARPAEPDTTPMLDIVFIAGGLAFFALTAGYTALCDRL